MVEQRWVATEWRVADIDPLNCASPVDDKSPMAEEVRRLSVRRPLEHPVGLCHLVSRIRKDREAERAVLLKPSPRQLRRVGADGNHPRTNLAEERQVPIDLEKLPDAANAVVAVVEDQNHRPSVQQFPKVPDFALGIGEVEVGCLPAQERVVMGGMTSGWARIFGSDADGEATWSLSR